MPCCEAGRFWLRTQQTHVFTCINFFQVQRKPGRVFKHLTGFYTKLNVWGSLGLNFEYDWGPIIEIGGSIFLYKLQTLEGSTSFREGSVLSPGQ